MNLKEKVILVSVSILIAFLFLVSLTFRSDDKVEKDACQSMCELRDSDIRVYGAGVCVCQK